MFCSTDSSGTVNNTSDTVNNIRVILYALLICFFAGLLIIALFGLWSPSMSGRFLIVGVGLLLAGGVFFLGGLLGFLFAIPHTTLGTKEEKKDNNDLPQYQPNTNLEQISDWLTKILVGVGLTQLLTIPGTLTDFGVMLGPSLGGSPNGGVFAVAILIFFSIDGFLVGYLWTRKYYANELQRADIEFQETQTKTKRNKMNLDALNAAYQTLTPQLDQVTPSQEDLDTKIAAASDFTREAIYSIALNQRYRNYYGGTDLMRTEPIFRSLLKNDPNNAKYHENLGYVLIRKQPPDWSDGNDEFSKAIQFRLPEDGTYFWYEGYRAVCRIHLDKDFNKTPPEASSDPNMKKNIINDLEAARQQPEVIRDIRPWYDMEITSWAALNGYPWPP